MGIFSALHIEPTFHAFWRWSHSRSDHAERFSEQPEQTILSYYALRPKDLPELLREAWALEAVRPIESVLSLLERRLDNVVFRMGFAPSIPEARSLIAKGYILVNRHRPRNTRMSLCPGDVVHLTRNPYKQQSTPLPFRQRPLPSYLQYLNSCTTNRGVMLSLPKLGHSPFPFNDPACCTGCEPIPGDIHG
jgi:small subunit ribosomal protein S4